MAGAGAFSAGWLVGRLHRRQVAEAAGRWARGRLLDVGCGSQPLRHALLRHARGVVGLEHDRRRYRAAPPQVWGSALALPFADSSFDTVYASQVLEHVPEPAELLAEAGRVLRPGGHLILTAPHIWGIHEEPEDYFRFTRYGLHHLACRAGLETLEVRAMGGFWVTVGARLASYLGRWRRGGLVVLVRPLIALVQLAALLLDRLDRVEGDTWNYLLVARRPGGADTGSHEPLPGG
ncbi:MAG: class I SAM-dependent methyltransferase [Candidatus Latescibacterota bacterium]